MSWGAVRIVLLLVIFPFAVAKANQGPGFDPTPVAIPKVANAKSRPMNSMDLVTIRDLHGVTISPDGRYVAFVVGQAVLETNSYRSGLFVVNVAAGRIPISLGTAGAPHWDILNQWPDDSEAPQWSPDSRQITYIMRLRSSDQWQLWRWNRTGGKPIQLSHAPGNVVGYRWVGRGAKIVLSVERPRDRSRDPQVYESGILYDGTMRPFRGRPIVTELLEHSPPKIETWIHDVVSGRERKATSEEFRQYGPWVSDLVPTTFPTRLVDSIVSPDNKMVAYRFFDADPALVKKGSYELYVKPVTGGSSVLLGVPTYYIGEYWWSTDSRQVFYAVNKGDGRSPDLMVAPTSGGAATELFRGTGYVTGFSPDSSGAHVACVVETSISPPEVAVLDIARHQVIPLVNLNPEFGHFRLMPPVRIDGTNVDGDPWFAYLIKPLDYEPGKKYPLIITTYGSSDSFLRGASGDEYPMQVFSAHGFAVLNINFGRARLNRPHNFQEALQIWQSPLDTLRAALNAADGTGIVDTSKVGISGFSHGAEILEYAISHAGFFRAAIESGSAARDPFFYYMGGNGWLKQFSDWGLDGWPEGIARSKWKQLAASLNADQVSAPLLTNAADSEFLASLALYTSLRELNKPVEIFVYPNELHVKNQPRHRYEIYNRNLDWFRFWLKEEEDPDPSKAEQYTRWRKLRILNETEKISILATHDSR
jgi:dipeptidyl aminopeptidase/acylaminoacyl peptidase